MQNVGLDEAQAGIKIAGRNINNQIALDSLPHPGIEPKSLVPLSLAGGFFTTAPPGKPR